MPTPLTSLANVLPILGISYGDAASITLVNSYITRATQAILDWCKVKDFGLAPYTEVRSGNNTPALALRQIPVQGITLAGNTTAGSAVITNLPLASAQTPSASNLFVNQSVSGPGIPAGTTVSYVSQASTGQITLSQPATATATAVPLAFGIALWADNNAFGGSAPGAFASTTLLTEGQDYYLDYDGGPGTACSSGLVYRLGYYWFRPVAWEVGVITPQTGPPTLNLKAQYLAGYATVPTAVTAACELLIAKMRQSRMYGQGVESMSRDGLSVSLAKSEKTDNSSPLGLFTAEIRELLAPYVKTIVAEN